MWPSFCLAVCQGPGGQTVSGTKDELLQYYKDMLTIRRLEIMADKEYKVMQVVLCPCVTCGRMLFVTRTLSSIRKVTFEGIVICQTGR
jgi:hypothetical protein